MSSDCRHGRGCCRHAPQPYEQVLNALVSLVDDLLVGFGVLMALLVAGVVVAGLIGWLFT